MQTKSSFGHIPTKSEANEIMRRALNDGSNSFEPIGNETDSINEIEIEGMTLVERAEHDGDVAIYADAENWAIVADANGPVVVRGTRSNA